MISVITVTMAIIIGRMVTSFEPLLPICFFNLCEKPKPLYIHYHSAYVVLWDHVANEKPFNTTTLLMVIKLGRMLTKRKALLPIVLLYHLVTFSCEITWHNISHDISATTVFLATKIGRIVTNLQGLLPLMLLKFLV